MHCYACDREAVKECPRCGALYCDEHGDALCARCMDPTLALPSYRVYRGSLVALLAGTAFAVWLLVRPPSTTDADSPVAGPLTAVAATATETATPTPTVTATATPIATATATATPQATEPPAPESATLQHTVVEGDSLFSIAELYVPADTDVLTFAEEIAALNELTDVNSIFIGQALEVPNR